MQLLIFIYTRDIVKILGGGVKTNVWKHSNTERQRILVVVIIIILLYFITQEYTNHHWFPLLRCLRAMTDTFPVLPPHISSSRSKWITNNRRCVHILLRSIADDCGSATQLPPP